MKVRGILCSERDYLTYAIGPSESGPIKIGKSTNPDRRLASLQTASPDRLSILHVWRGDIELKIHDKLMAAGVKRLQGEWFEISLSGLMVVVSRTATVILFPANRNTKDQMG